MLLEAFCMSKLYIYCQSGNLAASLARTRLKTSPSFSSSSISLSSSSSSPSSCSSSLSSSLSPSSSSLLQLRLKHEQFQERFLSSVLQDAAPRCLDRRLP